MPVDRSFIGAESETRTIFIERGPLKFFAKATGETNPIYFDLDAAKAAGHPDLPVPPTYSFTLGLLAPSQKGSLKELGIDIGKVLHGEQAFTYHKPLHAGETVTLRTRIADIYDRRGGALEFVVFETDVFDGEETLCVSERCVTVVRNG